MVLHSGLMLLFISFLAQRSCSGQDTDVLLTLSPLPLTEDREYAVPPSDNFTVTCTAMSDNPSVFVLWRRTDGSMSSLIVDNGTNATLMMSDHDSKGNVSGSGGSQAPPGVSASGSSDAFSGGYEDSSGSSSGLSIFSGESASGNDSAVSGSGNYSGSASGDETGTSDEQYTLSALLQVRAEDGGIQCSDAGQYECIAGVISPGLQAGSTISVNISVAIAGICCREEVTSGSKTYIWPETPSNTTVVFQCPNNAGFSVRRECSSEGKWRDFDRDGCGVLDDRLSPLIDATKNLTNETLSEHVATLTRVLEESVGKEVDQNRDNLNTTSRILSNVTKILSDLDMSINESIVMNVVKIVDSLLQWTPTAIKVDSSSRIMKSFEDIVSQYVQDIPEGTSQTLNFTSLTLVSEKVNLDYLRTKGRRFSAVNGQFITTEGNRSSGADTLQGEATIDLPASLFKRLGDHASRSIGIYFGLYETASLFPVEEKKSTSRTTEIFSYVLAATVGQNLIIRDLKNPVVVSFKHQNKEGRYIDNSTRTCVSWNFTTQNWTSQGCNTSTVSDGVIRCECNHLTNFGVQVEMCLRKEDCQTVTEELEELNNTFANLTAENVEGAVSSLSNVLGQTENNEDEQNDRVLGTVANYFNQIANFSTTPNATITNMVVNNVARVVSSLLQWNPENVAVESSSRVIESFEVILSVSAQQAPLNETQNFILPSLTIRTERRNVMNLITEGRSFSIGDDINETIVGSEDQVTSGELPTQHNAAIILPGSLFRRISQLSSVGTVFGIYKKTNLFPVGGRNAASDDNETIVTETGSQILSATVGNDSINLINLREPVSVTLRLNINDTDFIIHGTERCVTWDFDLQDWTTRGCTTTISQDREFATCTCNHLTNFCVLVDICLRENPDECQPSKVDRALTYISYIGMPISIASLVLTLISLIIFKNVRQKDISKLHIQLCIAMLLMLIVALAFVVISAETLPALYGGCVFVSLLVHYFALTSLLWMGAEALVMFQKLVLVFVQTTTKYIIILSIICWSAPAVPVIITLISDLANGNEVEYDIITRRDKYEKPIFCFLSHPGAFWGAFLAPLLAIILFNAVIFVCVIVVLIKHVKKTADLKNQSVSKNEVIRLIFSIGGVMALFGLTWLFAILTFSTTGLREAFQILFTIFNSFQGLFIFVFLCVMNGEVRDNWKSFFIIKPQASTPNKQKFDRKPNPNYTTTTGTLDTSCKSPTSTTPLGSTSEAIPWKEKLSVGNERASVCITMPFDDVKDDNDDVFEDDEKKLSDSNKQNPQPELEREAICMEKKAADEEKESESKKQIKSEAEKEPVEEKAVEEEKKSESNKQLDKSEPGKEAIREETAV